MGNATDVVAVSYRTEFGVRLASYRKRGGWTEIVSLSEGTDAATVFDHSAFDEATGRRELRNALRRHARWIKGAGA